LNVAVLGAGSWGTALAFLLNRKGVATRLWTRDAAFAEELSAAGENQKYLPGASLQGVCVSSKLEEVLTGVDCIVAAIPCAGVPQLAQEIRVYLDSDAYLISGTKGLHPASGMRSSELWHHEAGLSADRYVALSGPNLAREIAAGVPTSTVVASECVATAQKAQKLFGTRDFRVYTNDDLLGVELGGALKNVVAIAAGISDGLSFGDNAKAALMTRAWHEMTQLAVALGARESTLFGLSGIGDLFATCTSRHSRNHSLGCLLARGESLSQAQHEVAQVAEGVHTTRAALLLAAQHRVELPITQQIAAVLFDNRDPREAVMQLMSRQERSEN
jgi:glycerol-3-phosphate dehydrogenase (NAD(P)+)